MTHLQTMYPGVANSPETFLKEALTIDGTIMYLADGSVLGEIPTLAVIGEGQQAETVLVTSTRSDGGYTIKRGVEGPKKAWTKATTVARNWTNKDYEALVQNIKQNSFYINNLEDEFKSNVLSMQRYTDNKANKKVDKIAGKGLSTNDYDDAAKKKVDAIPPNPKYTDTVPDLTPYAKEEETNEKIESVGAATESIRQHLDQVDQAKLNKTDVVNDLTTGGADKALSAEQGKILEDTKLNKTDIVNDLTTGGVDKALSAEQGKTLFTYADNGKKSIADAIVGKGVDATKSDDFNTLADKISKIKTGYGVGEEVSVEEIKTFHPYEKESDYEFRYKKLGSKKGGAYKECGPPSALTVDSYMCPYVVTTDKELLRFDSSFFLDYVAVDDTSFASISAYINGDVIVGYEGLGKIFGSKIGVAANIDGVDNHWWTVKVGVGTVKTIKVNGNCAYCGVGNQVVKVCYYKKIWEFLQHGAEVNALTVDDDGYVYSGGADNKVFKISPDGNKIWEFTLHTAAVNALAVDSDGYLYSGGADCTIYKISPDGKKVWEDKTNNEITAIAVAPDGSILCGTTGSTFYTYYPDVAPKETAELEYEDKDGKVHTDGDVVDIVVANDASIFMVTKKEKVIYKMKYGEYKTSYKIIK